MVVLNRIILQLAVRAIIGIVITNAVLSLFEDSKPKSDHPEELKKQPA